MLWLGARTDHPFIEWMDGRYLAVDYTDVSGPAPDGDTRPALLIGERHASELTAVTGDWLTLRTLPSRIATALDAADTEGGEHTLAGDFEVFTRDGQHWLTVSGKLFGPYADEDAALAALPDAVKATAD